MRDDEGGETPSRGGPAGDPTDATGNAGQNDTGPDGDTGHDGDTGGAGRDGDTDGAGDTAGGHGHTVRWVVIGVVVVLAVVGGALFARAWSERGAEEASVDEALESQEGASTVPAATLRPATGVYTYTAEGSEELSLLDTGQDWGSTLPATVESAEDAGAGCWAHRIEYSTHHSHSQTYCPDGPRLLEVGGAVFQRFDFVAAKVDEETQFTCDPPNVLIDLEAEPGDSWPASCDGASAERGTSTNSAGEQEFLGRETLEIGGEQVEALHYRQDRTITGDQDGVNRVERWYDASTGLLLKGLQEVEVASPSPIGDVVYSESGSFEIDSLQPAG